MYRGSLDQVQSLAQLSLADCKLVPCLSLVLLLIYLQFCFFPRQLGQFQPNLLLAKKKIRVKRIPVCPI